MIGEFIELGLKSGMYEVVLSSLGEVISPKEDKLIGERTIYLSCPNTCYRYSEDIQGYYVKNDALWSRVFPVKNGNMKDSAIIRLTNIEKGDIVKMPTIELEPVDSGLKLVPKNQNAYFLGSDYNWEVMPVSDPVSFSKLYTRIETAFGSNWSDIECYSRFTELLPTYPTANQLFEHKSLVGIPKGTLYINVENKKEFISTLTEPMFKNNALICVAGDEVYQASNVKDIKRADFVLDTGPRGEYECYTLIFFPSEEIFQSIKEYFEILNTENVLNHPDFKKLQTIMRKYKKDVKNLNVGNTLMLPEEARILIQKITYNGSAAYGVHIDPNSLNVITIGEDAVMQLAS